MAAKQNNKRPTGAPQNRNSAPRPTIPPKKSAPRRGQNYSQWAGGQQMHIPIPKSGSERASYNYSDELRRTKKQSDELQKKLGKKANPKEQIKKSPAAPKKKAAEKNGTQWTVPDGSPVYTSKGAVYKNHPSAIQKKQQRKAAAARKAAEKERRRNLSNQKSKMFFIRLGIWFVITLGVFGLVYRSMFVAASAEGGSIDYNINIADKATLSGSGNVHINGVMYINFSDFAEFFNMTSVGSVDSMRFIIPDEDADSSSGTGKEEYVIFTDGMRSATLNGSGIILESVCYTDGLDFWVPYSFVEHYVLGITSEKNSRGTVVTVKSAEEELDKDGKVIMPRLCFSMRKSTAISPVSYPG